MRLRHERSVYDIMASADPLWADEYYGIWDDPLLDDRAAEWPGSLRGQEPARCEGWVEGPWRDDRMPSRPFVATCSACPWSARSERREVVAQAVDAGHERLGNAA